MSHTYHTTPAFPRSLRGPRGGRFVAPTPCVECVAFKFCKPGAYSAPFGCDSWVDEDGRRVDVEADDARLYALAGLIPEGLTAEDWAGMTTQERATAEAIDSVAGMPTPEEDAVALAEVDALESRFEPDAGPLFKS